MKTIHVIMIPPTSRLYKTYLRQQSMSNTVMS